MFTSARLFSDDLRSFTEKKTLTLSKNGENVAPPSNDSTNIIVPFMDPLFAKLFSFFIFGPDVFRQLFA